MSDKNPHIIDFYKSLNEGKISIAQIKNHLEQNGKLLYDSDGEFYYELRNRFNLEKNPLDFLFLSRSCFNGMMRFNKKGGFNVPFCKKPDRFRQAYITKILNQTKAVKKVLDHKKIEFINEDYQLIINRKNQNSLIYCDPPYAGRHTDYFDSWDSKDEYNLSEIIKSNKSNFIYSSWLGNKYRINDLLKEFWGDFYFIPKTHFYHIGASENNRNSIIEVLVTNKKVKGSISIKKINNDMLEDLLSGKKSGR